MAAGYEQTYDPDPQEQIDDAIRGHLAEVHTAIPGRIERYDPDKGLVDVKPLIKRRYSVDNADGDVVVQVDEYPVIPNCPIEWPRGGGFCLQWPLEKGDPCMIHFAERSLDAYLDSDGASLIDPDDARVHDLTDAVVYPGMTTKANPIPNAPTDHLRLGKEDGSCEVRVTGDEFQVVASTTRLGSLTADKALALAEKVDARLDALEDHTNNHTHLGNMGAPTSTAIVPLVDATGSTASGKVFTNG